MAIDLITLSRDAWNALRSESQPAFDDLEESYRQGLLDRAQRIQDSGLIDECGGVFQTFEQNVLEELNPERFHPLSKQFQPIPEEVKEELIEEAVKPKNTPKKAAAKKAAAKKTEKKVPAKKPVKVIKGGAKKK